MKYELSLKLKNLGFYQSPFRSLRCPCIDTDGWGMYVCMHSKDEFIAIPTLEELIGQLWDETIDLHIIKDISRVSVLSLCDEDGTPLSFQGSIPWEALANLWIEKNKRFSR